MKKKILELLQSYKQYNKLDDLENSLIELNCKNIGCGSSRVVYNIAPNKVAKIALDLIGTIQNKTEYNINQKYYFDLLPKIYNIFNNGKVIIVEYVKQASYSNFKKTMGISFNKFIDYLWSINNINNNYVFLEYFYNNYSKVLSRQIISFIDFIKKNDIPTIELSEISQWGYSNNSIKLIDYGATNYILNKYY